MWYKENWLNIHALIPHKSQPSYRHFPPQLRHAHSEQQQQQWILCTSAHRWRCPLNCDPTALRMKLTVGKVSLHNVVNRQNRYQHVYSNLAYIQITLNCQFLAVASETVFTKQLSNSPLLMRTAGSFPRCTAAGAWSGPLISIYKNGWNCTFTPLHTLSACTQILPNWPFYYVSNNKFKRNENVCSPPDKFTIPWWILSKIRSSEFFFKPHSKLWPLPLCAFNNINPLATCKSGTFIHYARQFNSVHTQKGIRRYCS